ncbi:MAG: peptidyl-prolyl cis-trans isomerase [Pseudomonadota bacterium]
MFKVGLGLTAGLVAASFFIATAPVVARDATKSVSTGKTQVVARAAGREITLSELRAEMARLRLSVNDPQSEPIALESLINRVLLSKAARRGALHRRPEAIAMMHAAQDQALADLYLGVAAQPPEPTRAEIDAFIRKNPELFAERRVYDFSVLTLGTQNFDEAAHTPLFDETKDLEQFQRALAKAGAPFSVAGAVQASTAFPLEIRRQLAAYKAGDNIVLRGPAQTQIMKIMRVRKETTPSDEWGAFARRALLDEASAKRAGDLVQRLKDEGDVAYYRPSAAPAAASGSIKGESNLARGDGR